MTIFLPKKSGKFCENALLEKIQTQFLEIFNAYILK
jgi:hypothetical protein